MHIYECEQREGVMRRWGVLLTVVTLLMVGCGNGQAPSPPLESTMVPSPPPMAPVVASADGTNSQGGPS